MVVKTENEDHAEKIEVRIVCKNVKMVSVGERQNSLSVFQQPGHNRKSQFHRSG